MTTTRQLPGKIFLILALQCIIANSIIAQNQPEPEPLIFAPLPDALVSNNGKAIESPEQWEETRREEILKLFRDHVYGNFPQAEINISHEVMLLDRNALDGSAVQKEVAVHVSNGQDTLTFTILIYLPVDLTAPSPLFLGLNFYGNHTIHPDEQISITDSWSRNNEAYGITENRATPGSRGVGAHRWPVELILSGGYGLATIYYGDIDPDFHDGFRNGIHRLFPENGPERDPGAWGSIAAWAWGLSRALDYFETDPDVDQGRVAVIGHSRLGKTSLWAGAQDERFALVISNNSGCGGAALSRRAHGERVTDINSSFPHWFASRFHEYNDNEAALPVDQHMLMALMAPRPLYVASAEEDLWADPHGEYLSLYYASQVYGLYEEVALENDQLPETGQPLWSGSLGYHVRTGKHDVTLYDWGQYLDFADAHLAAGQDMGFENPVSLGWLKENIQPDRPRLILTPELETRIRSKLEAGDLVTTMGFQLLQQSADSMLKLDPLTYRKTGRRLLGVSREAIRRLTTLALVYRFEKDEGYLKKLDQEIRAVCSFADWNPSHFLDVGEMAAGVALALDWAGEWLPPSTLEMARSALVNRAIKPGLAAASHNSWTDGHSNWNLVCNGGLSLAALAVFEDEPELASAILHQAVESIPLALEPYAPGGVYPEGASYWFYATTYLAAAISSFESALGTDFGFTDAPGVMESAVFSQVLAGPSGNYYNYFDASLGGFHSLAHFGLLSWFASRSGSGVDWSAYRDLLTRELKDPGEIRRTRFFSMHFLSVAVLDQHHESSFAFPEVWIGEGDEPICIFRDEDNDEASFFLAAKGGRAADNHGNMDAGSFIFELDGVRWSVDPGNQGYHDLEVLIGGELWNRSQSSARWSLLTKNNFGHSTLTVNGEMHRVDARSSLIRTDCRSGNPGVTFDLTDLFGESMELVHRNFSRPLDNLLRIRDDLKFSPETQTITWQLITCAEVQVKKGKVLLSQDGRKLFLHMDTPVPYEVKVVNLSPPPLPHDKNIPGLKRIEFRFKREAFPGESGQITVDLTTDPMR